MPETSFSLLERLRSQPDDDCWQQLLELYTPLVRSWLRRHGLADADAEDLVQEVLAMVVRELPHFEHNRRPGAFRGWLRAVVLNRWRDFWRGRRDRPVAPGGSDFARALAQLEDPNSELSQLWDREHGLAWSSDGRLILSAGEKDRTIRLWEVKSGRMLKCLEDAGDHLADVAFSPDNKRFLSCGWRDATVRLWDLKS